MTDDGPSLPRLATFPARARIGRLAAFSRARIARVADKAGKQEVSDLSLSLSLLLLCHEAA